MDHRLLCALSQEAPGSLAGLPRSLGLPKSTVEFRVRRLREQGILCGDMHEIRGEKIGLHNFILLVDMKGLTEETHRRFHQFVRKHRLVTYFSYEIGVWDYMVGVAAEQARDVGDLVERLHRQFGDAVSTVKSFPMFRARKVRDYPRDPRDVPACGAAPR